jgi:hypothetical protein
MVVLRYYEAIIRADLALDLGYLNEIYQTNIPRSQNLVIYPPREIRSDVILSRKRKLSCRSIKTISGVGEISNR